MKATGERNSMEGRKEFKISAIGARITSENTMFIKFSNKYGI